MHTLLFFSIYLGAALLLAAQLFYPVYQLLDAYWEIRPDRLFYRLAMVIAILGFWPFVKLLGINNRFALGYALERRRFLHAVLNGLGIGIAIMALHAGVLLLSGARVIAPDGVQLAGLAMALASGLLSGILVAFIEESFFRGAMQYHLRYSNPLLQAMLITSLLYAAVHFIHPPRVAESTAIDWSSGREMLLAIFHQYRDISDIADSFVALFAAGMLLSLVRERSGNIALCIGIHAGWVLSIKLAREATDAAGESPAAFLIGSYDGIIGWAAAALLAVVTAVYWKIGPKTQRRTGSSTLV